MPFNGAGLFTRVYQWVNDEVLGLNVDATRTDTDSNDIATGLSNCVTRDGQSPLTANIPAGGFKITNMGSGSSATDSVNYGQVFNSPNFFTPYATTSPPLMDNSLRLATTSYVVQTVLAMSLPTQSLGFLQSDGATVSFTQTHTGYAQKEVLGANIASAATINLTTATGNLVHVTGNVGITNITIPSGAQYTLIFDGAPLVTHSAALLLPSGVNIQMAAGDRVIVRGDTAGANVIVHNPGNATSADIMAASSAVKPITPAAHLAAIGFNSFAQTADQVITSGGALTIAHGLGRSPVMMQGFLKNITAENGYVAGDVSPVNISTDVGAAGTSVAYGVAITFDAINIYVRYSNSGSGAFSVINKTTGLFSGSFTNSRWSFFLRVLA